MKHNFFQKKLKNGMKIILEQRPDSGVVSLVFAVRHGGIHEGENERGLSHFIEHLLYKGTKKRNSRQISEAIEKNGGVLNGFTDEELTAFWCKMPADKLDVGFEVLSDMILNPLFDGGEIEKERKVIFEEIKMRRDRPDIYIADNVQKVLYDGVLADNTIGTEESLGGMNRDFILNRFNQIYGSQNLIFCIVGDVKKSKFLEICTFCEKNFRRTKFIVGRPETPLKNSELIEKREGLNQAQLGFAYHLPRANEKESYAANILSTILSGGMSSRIFQEIREKRNLAYSIKGGYNAGRAFGYGAIFIGASPDKIFKIKEILMAELADVAKNLSDNEFRQAVQQIIGQSKISKEESQGQMLDLLYNEIWSDDASRSYDYEKNIGRVEIQEVKKLAKSAERYSFIALIPKKVVKGA